MHVKLIVLRTANMEELVRFYTLLGMEFEYHKHGTSPYHYAAKAGETVIEIYPLGKNQPAADANLRLGFYIHNFEEVMTRLGDRVIVEPQEHEWGVVAIAQDSDGRKVELYKEP